MKIGIFRDPCKDQNRVYAVKALRNYSGMGLREAKDIIDSVPPTATLEVQIPCDVIGLPWSAFEGSMRNAGYFVLGFDESGSETENEHDLDVVEKDKYLEALKIVAKRAFDDDRFDIAADVLAVLNKYS